MTKRKTGTTEKSDTQRPRPRATRTERSAHRGRLPLIVLGIIGLVIAVTAGFLLTRGDPPSATTPAAWSTASHQGGARLAVDRTLVDAGPVAYEQPVNATFRLKNIGDAALTLQKPSVSTLEGC